MSRSAGDGTLPQQTINVFLGATLHLVEPEDALFGIDLDARIGRIAERHRLKTLVRRVRSGALSHRRSDSALLASLHLWRNAILRNKLAV